jgi:DNA repair exonuclease SbcCD ATPase subunit
VYENSEATKKLSTFINPIITRYSAISEQGKSTQLILDSNTFRLKRFKEILGIDKIGVVVDELKEDIKDAKIKSESLLKEIDTLEKNKFELQDVPVVESIDTIQILYEALQKEKVVYDEQTKLYSA